MPIRTSLNKETNIIEVISFGDITMDDVTDCRQKMNQITEESGANKMLADARGQTSMPETADLFKIATDVSRSRRTAVLLSEGQPTEEDILLIESVALSAGATFRVFHSKEEAIDWLNNP